MRIAKYAFVPVVVAFAAFFAVLPQSGGDASVVIEGPTGRWVLQPELVKIDPGDRVAFRNDTTRTHTATCSTQNCWDSGDIQPGETVFVEIAEEGTYRFLCRYHRNVAGLQGTVTVGNPPRIGSTPAPSPSPSA